MVTGPQIRRSHLLGVEGLSTTLMIPKATTNQMGIREVSNRAVVEGAREGKVAVAVRFVDY
jgi:hypothetical protein